MAKAKERALASAAANGDAADNKSVGGALGALGALLTGNKQKLQERGEKIERLDDASEQLADDAKEFSSLADQIKAKMKARSWF